MELLFFTILLVYVTSLCYTNGECDYFKQGPIEIVKGNVVGTITIEEEMELWFEIQIEPGWQCTSGWCQVIHIGPSYDGKPRFPLINFKGDKLQISFTDEGKYAYYPWTQNSYSQYYIDDPVFTSTINDGNVHKIYTKFTSRKRVFIYDDLVLYNMTTPDGIYQYEYGFYYHQQYDVVVVRQTSSPLIPGNITNLCIDSTFKPTTDPTNVPTMEPTNVPTIEPTYSTLEPTIYPTLSPTNIDMNVNQEPTLEPTLEPTPKTIIKYVESGSAKMSELLETAFLYIGISVLLIATFGGIYYYRKKQKKIETEFKNTIETLKDEQSAKKDKSEIEMEPPIAFNVAYNKKEEEVEGENAAKNGNNHDIDSNNNDKNNNDADIFVSSFSSSPSEFDQTVLGFNGTTSAMDDGEC